MLHVNNLTYRVGGRTLFEDASAHIPAGHRVGVAGANGSGKTTLLRLIMNEVESDGGDINVRSRASIGIVSQDAPGGDQSPLEATLAADLERNSLLDESETTEIPERIAAIHDRLIEIEAHAAPSRAATILAGLGFDEQAQHRPLKSFSGGWRMRVALAAVLFREPDLLLLDEPTNHLDLEATIWLENHLRNYPHTMLMVSHDRSLLNNAVDTIAHLFDKKLSLYPGGYDAFERIRTARLDQNAALIRRQESERKRIKSFVDRFRAKATKARQAQSRLKILERMKPIAAVSTTAPVSFKFKAPTPCSSPLVRFDGTAVGYQGNPVLENLHLSVFAEDRIALLGSNGNGKTTLSRLIAGELPPLCGDIFKTSKLNIGYFAQDHLDQLETESSPLEQLRVEMPDASISALRGWLGRFGLGEDKAEVKAANLSGGEKTRLALALIAHRAPNMLILDEPTNHLDMDSRQALVHALGEYDGSIILVSHDRHLIEATADQLWLVADGKVEQFFGDLDEYRTLTLSKRRTEKAADRNKAENAPRGDRKDTRRNRAEARARVAPLLKEVEAAESNLEALQTEKEEIETSLSDPAVYSQDPEKMVRLSRRQSELTTKIKVAEDRWLNAEAALEEARAEEEAFIAT
jgi:ATP-binding cassette, subfamily F, member 3